MKELTIYQGGDFVIYGQIIPSPEDTSQDPTDFDILIMLSTAGAGRRITASTSEKDDADVRIVRKQENFYAANITSNLSERLRPGDMIVSVALKHKQTGVKILSQQRSIKVKTTKLSTQL